MAGKGLKITAKIAFMIYLLMLVFVIIEVAALDIIPMKYIYIALGFIIILTVVTAVLAFRRRTGRAGRIIGLILNILMIVIMVICSIYMVTTNSFLNSVGNNGKDTVEYAVVVRTDSGMKELKDIDGTEVSVTSESDRTYQEAQTKLTGEAQALDPPVTFKYGRQKTQQDLLDGLMDKDLKVIFLRRAAYDAICDDDEAVSDGTVVIYSVYVEKESNASAKAADVTSECYSVYITGLDTSGSIDIQSRSDVNTLIAVNPLAKKMLMISIPRDYYVKLHTAQAMDKLTHTGIYGPEETVATVEDLLGIDINYYFKCNFSTVVSVIDAVGGVDVVSPYAFTTHGRQNDGYSFVEGVNHLDGKSALAFARERKSFAGGDRQRIKNQQLVIESTLKKVSSSKTLLTNYGSILSAISGYMETSLTQEEIRGVVRMQLDDMSSWDISKITLDGPGASKPCYALGNVNASVVLQDEGTIDAAKKALARIYSEGD